MPHAQAVVNHLKPLISRGIVDCRNVYYAGKLCSRMIFEKRKDGNDARWRDVDGELVFPDGELLDVFR